MKISGYLAGVVPKVENGGVGRIGSIGHADHGHKEISYRQVHQEVVCHTETICLELFVRWLIKENILDLPQPIIILEISISVKTQARPKPLQ